jgi:hypothetical protein
MENRRLIAPFHFPAVSIPIPQRCQQLFMNPAKAAV